MLWQKEAKFDDELRRWGCYVLCIAWLSSRWNASEYDSTIQLTTEDVMEVVKDAISAGVLRYDMYVHDPVELLHMFLLKECVPILEGKQTGGLVNQGSTVRWVGDEPTGAPVRWSGDEPTRARTTDRTSLEALEHKSNRQWAVIEWRHGDNQHFTATYAGEVYDPWPGSICRRDGKAFSARIFDIQWEWVDRHEMKAGRAAKARLFEMRTVDQRESE